MADSSTIDEPPACLQALPTELLSSVLENLHALDISRCAQTSSAMREVCRPLAAPILVTTASGSNQLVLIDSRTGQEVQRVKALPPRRGGAKRRGGWQSTPGTYNWPTCAALGADGAIYVSQYRLNGVLRFERCPLGIRYSRIVASSSRYTSPEGLVVAHGSIYVVSVQHGTVSRLGMDGRFLEEARLNTYLLTDLLVLWGMCLGPDNRLYIAGHLSEGGDYRDPTPYNSGTVFTLQLSDIDGSFVPQPTTMLSAAEGPEERAYEAYGGPCPQLKGVHTVLNRPSNPAFCPHGLLHLSSFDTTSPGSRTRIIHKFALSECVTPHATVPAHTYAGWLQPAPEDAHLLRQPHGVSFTRDGQALATCHDYGGPPLVKLGTCGCESIRLTALGGALRCGRASALAAVGSMDQANQCASVEIRR